MAVEVGEREEGAEGGFRERLVPGWGLGWVARGKNQRQKVKELVREEELGEG